MDSSNGLNAKVQYELAVMEIVYITDSEHLLKQVRTGIENHYLDENTIRLDDAIIEAEIAIRMGAFDTKNTKYFLTSDRVKPPYDIKFIPTPGVEIRPFRSESEFYSNIYKYLSNEKSKQEVGDIICNVLRDHFDGKIASVLDELKPHRTNEEIKIFSETYNKFWKNDVYLQKFSIKLSTNT